MKLLSLTEDYPPKVGGGATYAYEISRRLKSKYDVDLSIITQGKVSDKNTAKFVAIKSGGYRGAGGEVNLGRMNVIYQMIKNTRDLQHDFDLINIYSGMATLTAIWLLKRLQLLRKPIVMCYLGSDAGYWHHAYPFPIANFYDAIERELFTGVNYDKYIVLDEGIGADRLFIKSGVPKSKIVKHYQGVDCNIFRPWQNRSNKIPVIGFIGRTDPFTGVDLFIDSIAEVSKHTKNFKLLLRVDDKFKEKMNPIAKNLGFMKNISYIDPLPFKRLPSDFYNKCDVVVSLDKRSFENPNVLRLTACEAMACGSLVINSSKPRKEWRKPTWVSFDRPDPVLLAEKIIEAMENKERYRKIRLNAREIAVKYFSWGRVAETYYKAFRSVV